MKENSNNQNLKEIAQKLSNLKIKKKINIMEVCGTHTTEYFKSGIRDVFPKGLNLIDGPGCPVCVTGNEYLDRAIEIGKKYQVIITTFGDLMRVPSSYSSLSKEKSRGMDIRVVYSPFDALRLAKAEPKREVMFLSVGFETTIPLEAVTIMQAKAQGVSNFSILTGNKLTPPAVKALLKSGTTKIDGFILPGHVSTILGVKSWRFIHEEFKKPSVIAGFMRNHLLTSTIKLIDMINYNISDIYNDYQEAVTESGNTKAQKIIQNIFFKTDAHWRGIGNIQLSGLRLKPDFLDFDSEIKFPVTPPPSKENKLCKCGEILTGRLIPTKCPLFGKGCTPQNPIGACMVSTEGACAAYYKYNR